MADDPPAKLQLKPHPPRPGPDREPSAVHDVKAILQANLKSEKNRHVNQPIPVTKKKSKRLRDYLKCVIFGNLFIVFWVWFCGANIVALVYGLAGIVILTLGLTWIMFQVMEDY
jgi:hypothetical protein